MASPFDASKTDFVQRRHGISVISRVLEASSSDDALVFGLLLLFGLIGMWLALVDAVGGAQLCGLAGG